MSNIDTLIKESFFAVDQNADGYISSFELIYALRCIGISPDSKYIHNEEYKVYSIVEYSKIAKKHLGDSTPKGKIIEALKVLDKSNSGKLSVDILLFLVRTMSDILVEDDYQAFKKYIDPKNDEFISIPELADKILA
ncbi:calmodulin, putative [Plasmodium vinckei brucechwatti]|uniref:non-specific serine/threonine protein kinase n=1 Tax=Plasmodium vinckei brucechwatti TaxID=119398 RepID=A0A6V7S796_PLAVN|nr:calmodulin, putative [Plasmodium vinckei brucechwatti]